MVKLFEMPENYAKLKVIHFKLISLNTNYSPLASRYLIINK